MKCEKSNRYFENVKSMIEYAVDDIEKFNSFEFKYGEIGKEVYCFVVNSESIIEINDDIFEFNDIIFNLNFVVPMC